MTNIASKNIIAKLKKSGLTGRGGGGFPTGIKWEFVKKAKDGEKCIVCNSSEGEPHVHKDGYLWQHHAEDVIDGIKVALETMGPKATGYVYLKKAYHQKFGLKLQKIIGRAPIKLFQKTGGYVAGEETVALNDIEGKRLEPRSKPPFPANQGLFGRPTLINNVETFYCVSKIAKGEYKNTRFYTISGDVKNEGVFELPIDWPIRKILQETGNLPKHEFFAKVGGGAIGRILSDKQLNQPADGAGAIIIYNLKTTNPLKLMREWATFFSRENCDKCVPCREGFFRLKEMADKGKFDRKIIKDLLFTMQETSFCPYGKGATLPFETLLKLFKKIGE